MRFFLYVRIDQRFSSMCCWALQVWFRNVENSPKYLNYRILKKFRNCNHKLPIETGRCKDISVSVTYHVYNLSHNASDIEFVGAHQRSYFNPIAFHKNIY